MSLRRNQITLGLALLMFFAGLFVWIVLESQGRVVAVVGIAAAITTLAIVAVVTRAIGARNIREGMTIGDEFTHLAKLYAAQSAFTASMYLWLLIFIFHDSFSKPETMLGIGILGAAAMYGLFLWFYRSTGRFGEE